MSLDEVIIGAAFLSERTAPVKLPWMRPEGERGDRANSYTHGVQRKDVSDPAPVKPWNDFGDNMLQDVIADEDDGGIVSKQYSENVMTKVALGELSLSTLSLGHGSKGKPNSTKSPTQTKIIDFGFEEMFTRSSTVSRSEYVQSSSAKILYSPLDGRQTSNKNEIVDIGLEEMYTRSSTVSRSEHVHSSSAKSPYSPLDGRQTSNKNEIVDIGLEEMFTRSSTASRSEHINSTLDSKQSPYKNKIFDMGFEEMFSRPPSNHGAHSNDTYYDAKQPLKYAFPDDILKSPNASFNKKGPNTKLEPLKSSMSFPFEPTSRGNIRGIKLDPLEPYTSTADILHDQEDKWNIDSFSATSPIDKGYVPSFSNNKTTSNIIKVPKIPTAIKARTSGRFENDMTRGFCDYEGCSENKLFDGYPSICNDRDFSSYRMTDQLSSSNIDMASNKPGNTISSHNLEDSSVETPIERSTVMHGENDGLTMSTKAWKSALIPAEQEKVAVTTSPSPTESIEELPLIDTYSTEKIINVNVHKDLGQDPNETMSNTPIEYGNKTMDKGPFEAYTTHQSDGNIGVTGQSTRCDPTTDTNMEEDHGTVHVMNGNSPLYRKANLEKEIKDWNEDMNKNGESLRYSVSEFSSNEDVSKHTNGSNEPMNTQHKPFRLQPVSNPVTAWISRAIELSDDDTNVTEKINDSKCTKIEKKIGLPRFKAFEPPEVRINIKENTPIVTSEGRELPKVNKVIVVEPTNIKRERVKKRLQRSKDSTLKSDNISLGTKDAITNTESDTLSDLSSYTNVNVKMPKAQKQPSEKMRIVPVKGGNKDPCASLKKDIKKIIAHQKADTQVSSYYGKEEESSEISDEGTIEEGDEAIDKIIALRRKHIKYLLRLISKQIDLLKKESQIMQAKYIHVCKQVTMPLEKSQAQTIFEGDSSFCVRCKTPLKRLQETHSYGRNKSEIDIETNRSIPIKGNTENNGIDPDLQDLFDKLHAIYRKYNVTNTLFSDMSPEMTIAVLKNATRILEEKAAEEMSDDEELNGWETNDDPILTIQVKLSDMKVETGSKKKAVKKFLKMVESQRQISKEKELKTEKKMQRFPKDIIDSDSEDFEFDNTKKFCKVQKVDKSRCTRIFNCLKRSEDVMENLKVKRINSVKSKDGKKNWHCFKSIETKDEAIVIDELKDAAPSDLSSINEQVTGMKQTRISENEHESSECCTRGRTHMNQMKEASTKDMKLIHDSSVVGINKVSRGKESISKDTNYIMDKDARRLPIKKNSGVSEVVKQSTTLDLEYERDDSVQNPIQNTTCNTKGDDMMKRDVFGAEEGPKRTTANRDVYVNETINKKKHTSENTVIAVKSIIVNSSNDDLRADNTRTNGRNNSQEVKLSSSISRDDESGLIKQRDNPTTCQTQGLDRERHPIPYVADRRESVESGTLEKATNIKQKRDISDTKKTPRQRYRRDNSKNKQNIEMTTDNEDIDEVSDIEVISLVSATNITHSKAFQEGNRRSFLEPGQLIDEIGGTDKNKEDKRKKDKRNKSKEDKSKKALRKQDKRNKSKEDKRNKSKEDKSKKALRKEDKRNKSKEDKCKKALRKEDKRNKSKEDKRNKSKEDKSKKALRKEDKRNKSKEDKFKKALRKEEKRNKSKEDKSKKALRKEDKRNKSKEDKFKKALRKEEKRNKSKEDKFKKALRKEDKITKSDRKKDKCKKDPTKEDKKEKKTGLKGKQNWKILKGFRGRKKCVVNDDCDSKIDNTQEPVAGTSKDWKEEDDISNDSFRKADDKKEKSKGGWTALFWKAKKKGEIGVPSKQDNGYLEKGGGITEKTKTTKKGKGKKLKRKLRSKKNSKGSVGKEMFSLDNNKEDETNVYSFLKEQRKAILERERHIKQERRREKKCKGKSKAITTSNPFKRFKSKKGKNKVVDDEAETKAMMNKTTGSKHKHSINRRQVKDKTKGKKKSGKENMDQFSKDIKPKNDMNNCVDDAFETETKVCVFTGWDSSSESDNTCNEVKQNKVSVFKEEESSSDWDSDSEIVKPTKVSVFKNPESDTNCYVVEQTKVSVLKDISGSDWDSDSEIVKPTKVSVFKSPESDTNYNVVEQTKVSVLKEISSSDWDSDSDTVQQTKVSVFKKAGSSSGWVRDCATVAQTKPFVYKEAESCSDWDSDSDSVEKTNNNGKRETKGRTLLKSLTGRFTKGSATSSKQKSESKQQNNKTKTIGEKSKGKQKWNLLKAFKTKKNAKTKEEVSETEDIESNAIDTVEQTKVSLFKEGESNSDSDTDIVEQTTFYNRMKDEQTTCGNKMKDEEGGSKVKKIWKSFTSRFAQRNGNKIAIL